MNLELGTIFGIVAAGFLVVFIVCFIRVKFKWMGMGRLRKNLSFLWVF